MKKIDTLELLSILEGRVNTQQKELRAQNKKIKKLEETIHETPNLPKDEQDCNHSYIGIDSTLRFGKCKVCGKQVVESKGQGWEEEFEKKFIDVDGDISSHKKAEHDDNFLFIKGSRVKDYIKQRFIEKRELIEWLDEQPITAFDDKFARGYNEAMLEVKRHVLKEEK